MKSALQSSSLLLFVSTFKVNSYNERLLYPLQNLNTTIYMYITVVESALSLSFLLVVLDKTNVFGVLAEALTADHDVVFADDRVLVRAHAAVY